MNLQKLNLLVLFFILISTAYAQKEEARLLRFPNVHDDQIVFTKSGDLYTVDREGGMARKLTNHKGFEMFAKISPDGEKIAFTGQYDGNTEVYIMPAEGGEPRRLTYTATLGRDEVTDRMGPNNIVMGWTPDSKHIIYRSRRYSYNSFRGQLFKVSVDGGLSQEIPLRDGGFCSYSPDGSKLAFNKIFREFRTWKYYRGGMADNIRIYNFETGEVQEITGNKAQDIIPMWIDDEIYFLSDRDRTMNLFVYDTNDETIEKVTNFNKYDIKFPSHSGNQIAFENGGYIYVMDAESKEPEKISIRIADDFLSGRNERKDASENIQSTAIAPDGSRVAFTGRGDVWNLPAEEGVTRNMTKTSGVHERDVSWSPNGEYLAYLSDKTGEFELYIRKADGSEPAEKITNNADTYKYDVVWSPNSKKIMWADRKFRLKYADVESKEVTVVDSTDKWEYQNYTWSPKGRYIAYVPGTAKENAKVFVYDTENQSKHQVSNPWFDSNSPAFGEEGKYLYFVSQTEYNPVYNNAEWNVAYQDMEKIYMVTLQKDTPNPFAVEDAEAGTNDDEENGKENGEEDEGPIRIDFDGIQDRIIDLPVPAGNYYNLTGLKDKVLYNYYNAGKGDRALKVYDLKEEKETGLGGKIGYELAAGKKKILVKKGDKYYVTDFSTSKLKLEKPVDLSGMNVKVNMDKEWNQIFHEAWRQMRDFFYVKNMHGLDWKAVREKYKPLLEHVHHRADLTYVIGEMIAELNVGHAYVGGGDLPEPGRIKTGLLGARLERGENGYYRIREILPAQNWNKKRMNPLSRVGVDVSEGDYIIAINGEPTNNMENIYAALVGQAGEATELTINDQPGREDAQTEVIKPLSDESELYYYDWITTNMEKVNEATDGQVGYIHVRDMGPTGLRDFMSNFYAQLDKKALIIDDRGNGGGNVSPMLIERLRREVTRANMVRGSKVRRHTPSQMILGPKVLLMNEYSASDGDLFPYSFKKHDLGPTIGVRTWGGVVGIRGSLPFIDGGYMRKPEFASYSAEKSEWIIEGHGVEPDIRVENDPHEYYQGKDAQLQKAIEVVKDRLEDFEPIPEIPEGPDKSGPDGQEE